MTVRSVSWTDPNSVAQLLSRVSAPRQNTPRPAAPLGAATARTRSPAAATTTATRSNATPSSGYGGGVPSAYASPLSRGYAGATASNRAHSLPPGVQAPTRFPVQDSHDVPRLEQTSENPSDRLDTLLAWTLDNQRCTGAFVADDNGLTLAAHGISEAHVSLVGPLLSALVGIRSIPGIDASAGALLLGANMMSWVETHTERGGFCLGAVGREPLSTRALEQLKEALEITVRGL